MTDKPLIYQFDDVRVELDSFRVFKAGEPVALEPKAFEALIFLLERRGRLVTKDELLDGVWKDAFVTPNALTRIVAQLRRALGEDARAARYIETVPTRGYRFIAEVEEREGKERAQNKTAHDRTLAALPFKFLGAGAEGDYFGVGLADSLITRLSNIRSLTVRSTSAVLKYGGRDHELAIVGRALRVELVLDGTVQRAGDRVRVTVQLVRVTDGKSLWGDTYDVAFVDIFQVQDTISAQVAEALRIQLTGSERERLAKRPTDDIEAYQLYLRGTHHLYKFTPDDSQQALRYFNEAIARDPTYALAYVGLSNAYGIAASFGDDESARRAEAAALKAIELDPTLAEVHAALAGIRFWQKRDARAAQDSFSRALELNPNSATVHHYYAWFLTATARFDEGEKHLRRALELDPLSPLLNVDQGLPLFFARRYDEARARYARALEFDDESWYAHLRLGEACEAAEDFARAVSEFERAVTLSGGDPVVRAQLARALALAGKKKEAQRLLDELSAKDAQPLSSPYYVALAYAALDNPDEAFAWLDHARAEGDKWLGWMNVDPRLDPLRSDARFHALLQRAGSERSPSPSGVPHFVWEKQICSEW